MIVCFLKNGRSEKLRKSASANLKKSFNPTPVFLVISAPGGYLILKLKGAAFIGGLHLKVGGAYFKERRIIHMKFKNFVIFFFLNNKK